MKTALALLLSTLHLTPAPALAEECLRKLDEVRNLLAQSPRLDARRADLSQLRDVAIRMATQNNQALCLQIADQLHALVVARRDNLQAVQKLADFATAKPLTERVKQLNSRQLINRSVRNRLGEEIGEISDLSIDPSNGQVLSVQVTSGGFLGIGERKTHIPWSQIFMTQDGSAIVLDLSIEDLQQRPTEHQGDG